MAVAGGVYSSNQVLVDGTSATYENYLFVSAAPDQVVGSYGCFVANNLGVSNTATLQVLGERLGREVPSGPGAYSCASSCQWLLDSYGMNQSMRTNSIVLPSQRVQFG